MNMMADYFWTAEHDIPDRTNKNKQFNGEM